MSKTRLYFVTDVHGSELCFRKFLNAAKVYEANTIILGGDITGKMIVPIVEQPKGTFTCNYTGADIVMKSVEEKDALCKRIRDSGYYPHVVDPDELEKLKSSPDYVTTLFTELMVESVRRWMEMAEQRLKGSGIKCYISPGNDDRLAIDEVLNSSSYVINPEERVVELDGGHEMITLGSSNPTPWNSPREVSEDIIASKIERMIGEVKDLKKSIFNVHVPPFNTPIDLAPKLDKDLKPIVAAGDIVMIPAGSTSIRRAIEKYQPLVGLHGHIHEAKGMVTIGKTKCFNPGSEYGEGILKGLVCQLDDARVASYLFTSG